MQGSQTERSLLIRNSECLGMSCCCMHLCIQRGTPYSGCQPPGADPPGSLPGEHTEESIRTRKQHRGGHVPKSGTMMSAWEGGLRGAQSSLRWRLTWHHLTLTRRRRQLPWDGTGLGAAVLRRPIWPCEGIMQPPRLIWRVLWKLRNMLCSGAGTAGRTRTGRSRPRSGRPPLRHDIPPAPLDRR